MARTEIFGFRREETMQRTILMVLSTMLMSGCATTDAPLECTGPDAPQVTIRYGDSQLSVNPTRAVVKRNGNFVFHLVPVNLPATDPPNANYRDVDVTVEGKTADDAWIKETNGTWTSTFPDRKLRICVPPMQDTVEYEYIVTVDTVGNLDPRVKVNN